MENEKNENEKAVLLVIVTFKRTKKGAANIKTYKLAVTIQNPCFVANDATKMKALILFHWCSNCKTRV